jgi:tripartite-type tricarboxylate transporter receptor subunit TctC
MLGCLYEQRLSNHNKQELSFVPNREHGSTTCSLRAAELVMICNRLQLMALTATAVFLATALGGWGNDSAVAEPYPARPIRIISPFGAGGAPDSLMRPIARQLADRLGQSVTIENRPGGGLTIATKAAAAADPDGYTLLQVVSALAYSTVLYPHAGYDAEKSFSPVATLASWSHLLVVPPSIPAASVQDFIAYAKENPEQLNIGFALGGSPQILAEMFKNASGAKFNSVPYRQPAQLIADLLAGRVHAFFGAGAGLVAMVKQGKLKALTYTGVTRYPGLPQVPTVIEEGLPELALNPSDWTGIVAPTGIAPDVIARLNAAINDILKSPDTEAGLALQGAEAKITTPSEFAAFLAAERKKWPPLVKAAGLKPE